MNRLAPDPDDSRFLRRVLMLVAIAAVILAIWRASDLLILAFGSMLGAIVIHAVAELYRERLHVPDRPALILAILTVLGILAFLVWLFGVQFAPQVNAFVVELPALIARLSAYLSQSPVGARIVDAVESAFAGSRIAQDIGGLVTGGGQLLLNAILLIVGALFFAADPKVYERGFLLLVPPSKRPAFEDALFDTGATLKLWLRAQIIGMITMGVMVGLGLWASGVPSSAALGLLTGISEFIPYVGPIAAMIPAIGLAATTGDDGPVIGALATFVVARIIQTNFITPYVQNRVVAIPPAVTLFAIIAIGAVFGVFGLFFSAALLVVGYTLVRSLYLREMLGEDIARAEHATLLGRGNDVRPPPA